MLDDIATSATRFDVVRPAVIGMSLGGMTDAMAQPLTPSQVEALIAQQRAVAQRHAAAEAPFVDGVRRSLV